MWRWWHKQKLKRKESVLANLTILKSPTKFQKISASLHLFVIFVRDLRPSFSPATMTVVDLKEIKVKITRISAVFIESISWIFFIWKMVIFHRKDNKIWVSYTWIPPSETPLLNLLMAFLSQTLMLFVRLSKVQLYQTEYLLLAST